MAILGIDPGKTGGMALLNNDGELIDRMPFDGLGIADIIKTMRGMPIKHAFIEQVASRPGQGVVSVFTFGRGFGEILGALAALEIPHTLVRPQAWAKVMHAGTSGTDPKARSLVAIARLFPGVDLRPTPRCKKPHAGLVDAVLIAEYGRRSLAVSDRAAWRGHV